MASASVSKQEAANTQLAKLFGYLQETVFACVSCELLKLNYKESKIDKQIGKEYIRLLSSSFNFEMWLPFTQVPNKVFYYFVLMTFQIYFRLMWLVWYCKQLSRMVMVINYL